MVMGVPDVIAGRYERRGVLGQGGMGTVYDAWDRRLERAVAVKVLRAEMGADQTVRARFEAEARAAATLNHPRVVAVYDSGDDGGTAFLVMERLPGHTLRHEIARGPVAPARLRAILGDVLEALSAAHDAGIVHRDVKPGNVLFAADGAAKVADFGIAKSAGVDLTGTGELVGTAAYIAPERLDGAPATPASDIYAVGVLAYEALSGHKPFDADTPLGLARAIADSPPPPLPDAGGEAGGLGSVIERAMRKRPEERFASAAAMNAAVAASVPAPAVEPSPPVVEPTPPPPPMEAPALADVDSTAVFEPTSVDHTDVAPPSLAPPPLTPTPEEPPPPSPPPFAAPDVVDRPEPHDAPAAARTRRIGMLAGAVAVVALVVAVAVAFGRGGSSRPKLSAGKASTTTTVVAPPPLADVAPKVLLPVVQRLTTGLELRTFASAKNQPVLEIADPAVLIRTSVTPKDDQDLYNAHPPDGLAAVAWGNRPSANTQVQLQILKFKTAADATAARSRMHSREEHQVEGLAIRMVDPKFDSLTDRQLGQIDVVHFFDPRGSAQNGQRLPALATRWRGNKGQYVFEIRTTETAGDDRKAVAPIVDPSASVTEVLARLADKMDSQLNPIRNP